MTVMSPLCVFSEATSISCKGTQIPTIKPSIETGQRDAAVDLACTGAMPPPKPPISLWDLLDALQVGVQLQYLLSFFMVFPFEFETQDCCEQLCTGSRALSYHSDLMLLQSFQPMAAQLSKKAALPLAKIFVTGSCRSSKTGPRTHLNWLQKICVRHSVEPLTPHTVIALALHKFRPTIVPSMPPSLGRCLPY